MGETSISINQEHFICSICLYPLKKPVTTPCGHSFCMVCLKGFWDEEEKKKTLSCPQCRETFSPRPVLRRNTVLSEIIDQLKEIDQQPSLAFALSLDGQDVECDSCIGVKTKAVKSCLTCLASYCDTHVQAHLKSPAFKRHMLITALSNLQEKTCVRHNRLLEVFCQKDQKVICLQCVKEKHMDHGTVPVQEEWMEKKKYFEDLQQKIQRRLKSREKALLELTELNKAYKHSVEETLGDSDKIFSEILVSIEKRRSELTEKFRDQEKAQLAQTAVVQEQLGQEIADLKKKQADLEKLSQTKEYIYFLQRFHFLYPKLDNSDSFKSVFTINRQWSFENFRKSLIQLKEEVDDFSKERIEEIFRTALTMDQIIIMPEPETREEFLNYSCELALDPNTANNYLKLSDDDTYMVCGEIFYQYPDHPDRFSYWHQVLCKQSVPLRSYWEVVVDGKQGVSLAVSYKDISRKGSEIKCRFGHNAKSWRLVRYPNKNYCFWHNDTRTELSKPVAKRIGVYLDQQTGTLSFYGVSDKMNLIYKVTTVFPQPLYAGFGIGTNSFAKICH